MKALFILAASAIITGCATAAIDVKPIAADAEQYQRLDCDALYLQCVKTSGDLRASYAKQQALELHCQGGSHLPIPSIPEQWQNHPDYTGGFWLLVDIDTDRLLKKEVNSNNKFTREIEAEALNFFEWPTEDRSQVTLTSCILFAEHIAKKELEKAQGLNNA